MISFKKFKNKENSEYKDSIIKDNYKTKDYYIEELTRINEFIKRINDSSPNLNSNYERYYVIVNHYLLRKIKILYVLSEDFEEIKKLVIEYCDNLSKQSEIIYREICEAISMVILFNISSKKIEFIKSKMVSEKYVDATLDLLRNKVFENKVLNTKDFCYKEKGISGNEYTKDNNGLLKAINATDKEIKNREFKKFLTDVKEKKYRKIIKYYDEIGEERYFKRFKVYNK